MLYDELNHMTFDVNVKHTESEYNQRHHLNLTSKLVVNSKKFDSSAAAMAEVNDPFRPNGVATNSEDSENGETDTAFENPVMKIVRGFRNVPDEAIRTMRFAILALFDEWIKLI